MPSEPRLVYLSRHASSCLLPQVSRIGSERRSGMFLQSLIVDEIQNPPRAFQPTRRLSECNGDITTDCRIETSVVLLLCDPGLTVVFRTGGATISAVGEARKSTDVPLDTLTAHLDRVFARVPEAIVLLDIDDRILQVNPEFTRVFGYAQEEACGRLINELIVPEELLTEA